MNGSQLPMLIFLMLCQRKLNKPDVHPWTVCIDWRIMFSNYFQPLSQKVSIKDQFPGVEDRYNIYFTKGIYFCFYCGRSCYLYILQDVCFYFTRKKVYCCYSYNSVKVLEFCQKSWKSPGKSWNLNQFFWWETWNIKFTPSLFGLHLRVLTDYIRGKNYIIGRKQPRLSSWINLDVFSIFFYLHVSDDFKGNRS